MADIPKIAASLSTPSLANALQQAGVLANGQTIEAKIAQILANNVLKLTSSIGPFELQAAHPSLQVGQLVTVNISSRGEVTLTLHSQTPSVAPSQGQQAIPQPQSQNMSTASQPAVIANLSSQAGQAASPPPPAPATYSAGQAALPQQQIAVTAMPMATPVYASPASSQAVTAPASTATSLPPAVPNPAPLAAQLSAPSPPSVAPHPAAHPALEHATPHIANVLHEALSRQTSLAPLFANLDFTVRQAKGLLPPPLRIAIEQVLATLPQIEKLTPQALQQALQKSGVFLEANVAMVDQITLPKLQGDLKSALLTLDTVLEAVLPREGRMPPTGSEPPLAPPRAGMVPDVQEPRRAALNAQMSFPEIASTLKEQTETALSRLRVLQFASLPAATHAEADTPIRPAQSWHVDLPLALPGYIAVLPLQIERDAERRGGQKHERRWRVRFALALPGLGPIHVLLGFIAERVHVTLWAEHEQTYELISSFTRELHEALVADDLDIADIEFRSGSPHTHMPPAGSTVDRRT